MLACSETNVVIPEISILENLSRLLWANDEGAGNEGKEKKS